MARLFTAVAALAIGLIGGAEARPVSYEGGWTLIEMTDREMTGGIIHYTLNPSLSLGYRVDWNRKGDVLFNGAQATWLAKRWFGEDYQANVYVYGAAGISTAVGANPGGSDGAVLGGVMADWENRRYFVSYRAEGREEGQFGARFMQVARVGVAPYVGDTGDIHTWLMIEVDHRPDNRREVGVTPLLRLFKGPAMLEAGWSLTDNEPLLNFTYRF
jgi:hypothetical protein